MESDQCPQCRSSLVLNDNFWAGQYLGPGLWYPFGTSPSIWKDPGVNLREEHRCCVSCGLLWARVDPAQVRASIDSHADELTKQVFTVMEHGPCYDVPDVPEARQAAEAVLEMDWLVCAGRKPAATRRYRELKQGIWDEAISTVSRWNELKREEKLALFGWCPNVVKKDGDSNPLEHPMRDRIVDG